MAAIPLSRLTGTTPESHAGYVPSRVEAVDARPAATVPVHIRLVFSHAPVRCEPFNAELRKMPPKQALAATAAAMKKAFDLIR